MGRFTNGFIIAKNAPNDLTRSASFISWISSIDEVSRKPRLAIFLVILGHGFSRFNHWCFIWGQLDNLNSREILIQQQICVRLARKIKPTREYQYGLERDWCSGRNSRSNSYEESSVPVRFRCACLKRYKQHQRRVSCTSYIIIHEMPAWRRISYLKHWMLISN